MATMKWQSEDGYVRVVDEVVWSDEDRECSDLEQEYRTGAWIVFYCSENDDRWFLARSRRMPKPSLKRLAWRMPWSDCISINAEDSHGRVINDYDIVQVAQALYAAWQQVAADEIPAKIANLRAIGRAQINPDDYGSEQIPAWLRPGIPLHRESRRAIREVAERGGNDAHYLQAY